MRGLPDMEALRPLLLLGLLLLLGFRAAGERPLERRQGSQGGVAEGQRSGELWQGQERVVKRLG